MKTVLCFILAFYAIFILLYLDRGMLYLTNPLTVRKWRFKRWAWSGRSKHYKHQTFAELIEGKPCCQDFASEAMPEITGSNPIGSYSGSGVWLNLAKIEFLRISVSHQRGSMIHFNTQDGRWKAFSWMCLELFICTTTIAMGPEALEPNRLC